MTRERSREAARALVALAVVTFATSALTGCGQNAAKAQACAAAWGRRIAAIEAASKALDDAEASVAGREAAAKATSDEIEKKLRASTVASQDRETYPAGLKSVVAKQKMNLASMSPLKREPGKSAVAIRYDMEIQGEYRYLAKTLEAFYAQSKLFRFDRVEVNITDTRRKWSVVKAQGWVFETPDPPAVAPGPAPEPVEASLFAAATAGIQGLPECAEAVAPPQAAEAESKRVALSGRAATLKRLQAVTVLEARVAARRTVLDELTRARDQNRTAFTSRFDELVHRALNSVATLCELRFKPDGTPDWR